MRKVTLSIDTRPMSDVYGPGMRDADGCIPDAAYYGPCDPQYQELIEARRGDDDLELGEDGLYYPF